MSEFNTNSIYIVVNGSNKGKEVKIVQFESSPIRKVEGAQVKPVQGGETFYVYLTDLKARNAA